MNKALDGTVPIIVTAGTGSNVQAQDSYQNITVAARESDR